MRREIQGLEFDITPEKLCGKDASRCTNEPRLHQERKKFDYARFVHLLS